MNRGNARMVMPLSRSHLLGRTHCVCHTHESTPPISHPVLSLCTASPCFLTFVASWIQRPRRASRRAAPLLVCSLASQPTRLLGSFQWGSTCTTALMTTALMTHMHLGSGSVNSNAFLHTWSYDPPPVLGLPSRHYKAFSMSLYIAASDGLASVPVHGFPVVHYYTAYLSLIEDSPSSRGCPSFRGSASPIQTPDSGAMGSHNRSCL